MGLDEHDGSGKAIDAADDKGLVEFNAGLVDEHHGLCVLNGKRNDVILADDFYDVILIDRCGVRDDVDHAVELTKLARGGADFERPDVVFKVDELVVEIGNADNFVVCNADRTDSGTGKIVQKGGTETAGTDDKDTGIIQDFLSVFSQLRQKGLLGISFRIHTFPLL